MTNHDHVLKVQQIDTVRSTCHGHTLDIHQPDPESDSGHLCYAAAETCLCKTLVSALNCVLPAISQSTVPSSEMPKTGQLSCSTSCMKTHVSAFGKRLDIVQGGAAGVYCHILEVQYKQNTRVQCT